MQAGEAVVSEPEVRHVVLPESGGRIIVASDGLWDAINPKTAAHHVRGMPASKAAHDLVCHWTSSLSHVNHECCCSFRYFVCCLAEVGHPKASAATGKG